MKSVKEVEKYSVNFIILGNIQSVIGSINHMIINVEITPVIVPFTVSVLKKDFFFICKIPFILS